MHPRTGSSGKAQWLRRPRLGRTTSITGFVHFRRVMPSDSINRTQPPGAA